MFYIFFLLLIVAIPVVFYLSTRQFRTWPAIKERWFKASIENGFIFNSTQTADGTVKLELKGEYTFQYISCVVSISTSNKNLSVARVELPESLREVLSGYPVDTLSAFFSTVEQILSGQLEDLEAPYSTKIGETRRLNPKIVEQLLAIRHEYLRPGRRFSLAEAAISYEQDGLVVEPSTLFPVLDELVMLLYMMAENRDHLLVKA